MVYGRSDSLEIGAVDPKYHDRRLDGFDNARNGLRKCTVLSRAGLPYSWFVFAPDTAYNNARLRLQRSPTVGEVLKEMKLLEKAEK